MQLFRFLSVSLQEIEASPRSVFRLRTFYSMGIKVTHRFGVSPAIRMALAVGALGFVGATALNAQGTASAIQTELLPGGLDAKYDGEGFLFGVGVTGIYDSNLFLQESGEESDFSIVGSPWMSYRSAPAGGARVILGARYAPFVRAYLNNNSLNSLDHSANASLRYAGDVLSVGITGAYSRLRQANRFAATSVETGVFNFGVDGSYQVSPKTSITASWSTSMTDYQSGALSSSDSYSAQVTGFWQATPLVRLGPSVRHTILESQNSGEREALAFLLRLQYELTGKINLSADVGLEREENSRAGGDAEWQFTGGLSASYAMDALWSFSAGINYRTVASPTTQNYTIDDFGASLSVSRSLGTGTLQAGVDGSLSNYQPVGPVVVMREDEQVFGAFISHRLGLFEERVGLNTSLRFSKNSGQRDWSRFQLSSGFNYTF